MSIDDDITDGGTLTDEVAEKHGLEKIQRLMEEMLEECQKKGLPFLMSVQVTDLGVITTGDMTPLSTRPEFAFANGVIQDGLEDLGPIELLHHARSCIDEYKQRVTANEINKGALDIKAGKEPETTMVMGSADNSAPN